MTKESKTTKKIVTLGILSALGALLMLLEIPYPPVPFLKLEISDVVVLVVFMIYGFKESFMVGILKALVNLLVFGPAGFYAVGQIVAVIASMSYVFGMYVTTNRFHFNKYVGAVITIFIVTTTMVIANYLFVTPIYVGELTFLDVREYINPQAFGLDMNGGYLTAILIVYVPFNIIKGTFVTGIFIAVNEILSKTVYTKYF